MTLTFTDDEYRRLLTMTLLGEWMVNAIRKDPDLADQDALSKLCSFASGTPHDELVVFEEEEGGWIPSEGFEEDAHALIDQYDDKTFWEELTGRMTERDLLDTHGERVLGGMRPMQRIRESSAIAKAYTREFEEHGIDRLRVADDEPRRASR